MTAPLVRDDRACHGLPVRGGSDERARRRMRSLGSRSRYADSLVISRVAHSARGFPVRLFPSKQTDIS
jgi:hypothetical protein